jgi:hypothetical protein
VRKRILIVRIKEVLYFLQTAWLNFREESGKKFTARLANFIKVLNIQTGSKSITREAGRKSSKPTE